MNDERLTDDDPRDDITLEDVLESFNAGEVVSDPGVPAEERDEPESPTSDADLLPPA